MSASTIYNSLLNMLPSPSRDCAWSEYGGECHNNIGTEQTFRVGEGQMLGLRSIRVLVTGTCTVVERVLIVSLVNMGIVIDFISVHGVNLVNLLISSMLSTHMMGRLSASTWCRSTETYKCWVMMYPKRQVRSSTSTIIRVPQWIHEKW